MIAKLLKFLSGIAAMAGKSDNLPPNPNRTEGLTHLQCPFHSRALTPPGGEIKYLCSRVLNLRDTNVTLIRERRDLRNQLRRAESRADGMRGGEYAEELDRAKALLRDRHGFSVSRMQVASAVEDLSQQLEATRDRI